MSDLEGEAQPILGPLIAGRMELESLGRPARLALARWTAKTAYVLNWPAAIRARCRWRTFARS
jgi:hypothetical protein